MIARVIALPCGVPSSPLRTARPPTPRLIVLLQVMPLTVTLRISHAQRPLHGLPIQLPSSGCAIDPARYVLRPIHLLWYRKRIAVWFHMLTRGSRQLAIQAACDNPCHHSDVSFNGCIHARLHTLSFRLSSSATFDHAMAGPPLSSSTFRWEGPAGVGSSTDKPSPSPPHCLRSR
jgi:hypothetical protein